jgi:hypothetical protein
MPRRPFDRTPGTPAPDPFPASRSRARPGNVAQANEQLAILGPPRLSDTACTIVRLWVLRLPISTSGSRSNSRSSCAARRQPRPTIHIESSPNSSRSSTAHGCGLYPPACRSITTAIAAPHVLSAGSRPGDRRCCWPRTAIVIRWGPRTSCRPDARLVAFAASRSDGCEAPKPRDRRRRGTAPTKRPPGTQLAGRERERAARRGRVAHGGRSAPSGCWCSSRSRGSSVCQQQNS